MGKTGYIISCTSRNNMLETTTPQKKLTASQIKALVDIWGDRGEKSHAKLSGFSMWPLIKPDDSLIIDHNLNNINLGDIVVFQYQSKLVAHRVVKRFKNGASQVAYLTKGDGNCRFDQLPLFPESILGRVVQINGSTKTIDCSSFLWRKLNYLIAIYSYAVATFLK